MRLALCALLLLAACGGGGSGDAALDGGGEGPGRVDAGDGGGEEPTGCGPASCDGCCDGDTCRPGDGDDECGAGGAACQACGRWGECSAAAICELAAGTRWDVVVESATASSVNAGGTAWDGDGDLPDIYVRATAFDPASDSMRSERTDDHEDLTPTWNQTILGDLPGAALEGMHLELWDSDGNDDDSFGECIAAVRLEDVEAGGLELTCPRGPSALPPRAGWTLRLRLEPRSTGRADAPAFDRRAAAPLASEPGSCTMTWDGNAESVKVVSYDQWGRELQHAWRDDSGAESVEKEWVCSGDHCDEPGQPYRLRWMEPGPFGRRVRVDHDDDVWLYDSIGRLVAQYDYSEIGSRSSQRFFRYTARTRVHHYQWLDDSPDDTVYETTEFDDHGSPVFIVDGGVTRQVEVDRDGLPIRYEVVKSDIPEHPLGEASDVSYEGAGCAEVLAAQVTNGLVQR